MERDCQHGLYKAGMGSSRVLSDFAEKYGSKNRVLAGFGIGGKSGKEKFSPMWGCDQSIPGTLERVEYLIDGGFYATAYQKQAVMVDGVFFTDKENVASYSFDSNSLSQPIFILILAREAT
ncbi:hypothetical protein Tco_0016909 [Tanacetum coccineum]